MASHLICLIFTINFAEDLTTVLAGLTFVPRLTLLVGTGRGDCPGLECLPPGDLIE